MTNAQILDNVAQLVDTWCERRCLQVLGFVLQGFPLHCPHTDGWGDLLQGLIKARQYGHEEMSQAEIDAVDKIIAEMKSWNW